MNLKAFNLFLILAIIAVLGVGSYALTVKVVTIRKARADVEKIEKEIKGFGDYQQRLKNLEGKVTSLQQTIAVLEKKIFWQNDISIFIKEITAFAKDISVEFFSIKTHPPKEVSSFPQIGIKILEIPLTINMKVDFFKLVDFLNKVENFDKFVKIKGVEVKGGTEKNIYIHRVTLSLSALIKKPL